MKDLRLPFDETYARELLDVHGSPLHVYDEVGLRNKAKKIKDAFSWCKNYKNFYAVKAAPTPGLLSILHEEGMGFDCSSRAELVIMQRMGIPGRDIFFTSNNTPIEDFSLAIELGATVNLDDESQLDAFLEALGDKNLETFAARYNPGELKTGNDIIGVPKEAKYGMDIATLARVFNSLKEKSITRFGLHTMVASNELNEGYFAETASLLLDAVDEIEKLAGIKISFVNLGGGFGVNYLPEQDEFDIVKASRQIERIINTRRPDLDVYTENGRYVSGPHGYLLTKALYIMHKYKDYVGVDASMQNLMRPGMYGAYHHMAVLGKSGANTKKYDVVGSLCENNDKFCIDRELPEITVGDVLVIYDTGAHGHAMGFNYNGLLRSAEVLLKSDGTSKLIRKAQTIDELLEDIVW